MLPERYTHSFWAMTTRCELLFYGVDQAQGQRLASAIEARVGALVLRYNFHTNDSWLSRAVNGRRHSRVPLNAEAIQVLHTVRKHAEQCGGVFDITVGTYAAKLKLASSADDRDRLLLVYQLIGLVLLHWTLVLAAAIGCAIVIVMKGPAFVADPYPPPGRES